MRRIVLTGGPGAGKSVIAQAIAQSSPQRFVLIPEAATQVYRLIGSRWDQVSHEQKLEAQRRIYHFQLEQERRAELEHPGRILLLDRGTIDGAAYWPLGPQHYWQDLETDHETELARYDAVIWLETAAVIGHYDGSSSNEVRFEDAAGAIESGQRLLELWSAHRNLHRAPASPTLDDKLQLVRRLLDSITR